MPEHEQRGAQADQLSGRKDELRAARAEEGHPRGATPGTRQDEAEAVPSDDAEVASEPMAAETTLARVEGSAAERVPPGRQLSGDLPAV
jgi:hypothetical protein